MKEEKLLQLNCSSVLAPLIYAFVEQKRALGNKYNVGVEVFNLFDRFCMEEGLDSSKISAELLQKWSSRNPWENGSTLALRVYYVQGLAKFMHSNDFQAPAAFHPMPKRSQMFVPYIFSQEELKRLFTAIDKSTPENANSPLRHLVIPILFRMLYTCGLRVSEALHLRVKDVDLEKGTLIVLDGKGGKDRMVGISDSLLEICKEYRCHAAIASCQSIYFFPAADDGFYDTSTIYDYFRRCLFLAGIPHKGRGKGPRLHDLRHTYAVHVLNKWAAEGKDMYTCLPILSTYLGHAMLSATQKYLRLVPEAYNELTETFERKFKNVFPEVPYAEE